MDEKTCKDCVYVTKKIEEAFYCGLIKWVMNIESPACIKHEERKG